ncbi:hypothetical protein FRC04_004727 [Tulasnella sp. 424]|nr:hypothetical protein FRC04_004727 [Tulasnella sp. 424]KAG8976339.1 hypothetical protein FRC05_004255 [Tulasnella sp. 425]
MPTPGAPNGGGPDPRPDAEPDASETNSETTSSNITIQEHEFVDFYQPRHGRLFHTFPRSRYCLPADDEESTRLKEQHEIFQRLLGENYYQPLDNKLVAAGSREVVVLDLGCGPGIWVEEFSVKYPSAYFIGVDLVPMARQHLDDAHFECYDISDSGIRAPDGRDVGAIHARCLSFGFVESSYCHKTTSLEVIFAVTVDLIVYFKARIEF